MIAVIYAGLGEKEESFRWLERVYTERTVLPGPIRFDPRLDSLRGDPRFKKFLEGMGLPA